jgi:hypothetical protein
MPADVEQETEPRGPFRPETERVNDEGEYAGLQKPHG